MTWILRSYLFLFSGFTLSTHMHRQLNRKKAKILYLWCLLWMAEVKVKVQRQTKKKKNGFAHMICMRMWKGWTRNFRENMHINLIWYIRSTERWALFIHSHRLTNNFCRNLSFQMGIVHQCFICHEKIPSEILDYIYIQNVNANFALQRWDLVLVF